MKFEELLSQLERFSFKTTIGPRRGRILYNFVLDKKPSECLELGFAHGTSSCYIAAALDELGTGCLTSVDLVRAAEWQKPSIEELLSKTSLQEYVTVVRENTSYNWFLKKKIEETSSSNNCQAIYDFCFVDGSKHWTIDGFAFFLVDKLLKQGGWILFDDFKLTYNSVKRQSGVDSIDYISLLEMGEDELNTPHIELVFRLLVMQNPNYSEFKIEDEWWAWARKTSSPKRTLVIDQSYTFKTYLLRALRKLKKFAASTSGQ
jgi:predicted O-methyltransferase YrrM